MGQIVQMILTSRHTVSQDNMFLNPICMQEVITESYKLNISKSPGPDCLGPKFIKDIVSIIIEPLTYIYNLSFQTGIVPHELKRLYELKRATIIPIHKK
jgi:hypothetical protein